MTLARGDLLAGAGFAVLAIVFQALWLGMPAALLSVSVVVAFGLWAGSQWRVVPALRAAFLVSLLVFVAHAAEEYVAGFHSALPKLVGRAGWSNMRFALFNATWGVLFVAAALALRPGRALPALAVIFFAVAGGIGNGVFHLLLAMATGAYFPGAGTAPLCLAVGVWLLWLLYAGNGSTAGSH